MAWVTTLVDAIVQALDAGDVPAARVVARALFRLHHSPFTLS
jgi:hypothetical protein